MQAFVVWAPAWGVCAITVPFSVCVPVCEWVCVSMCVSAYIHTCTFVAHPQCQHPNHNYNVISRVWQCPCCCFTSTSFSLPWIPNAVMLSLEICTAFSQAHMFNVCVFCTRKERVGLGVGGVKWGGGGRECLTGKAKQQNISLKMRPVSHWSIVDPVQPRQPYIPFKRPLEARQRIQYACHTSRRKAQALSSHLPSKVICQSLGTAAGIKRTRVLLRQWLEKEGTCQTLTAKGYISCKAVGCRWMEFSFQLTSVCCILGGKMWELLLIFILAMPFVRHRLMPHILFNPLTEPREKGCFFFFLHLATVQLLNKSLIQRQCLRHQWKQIIHSTRV